MAPSVSIYERGMTVDIITTHADTVGFRFKTGAGGHAVAGTMNIRF